jgi:hypothetical protein
LALLAEKSASAETPITDTCTNAAKTPMARLKSRQSWLATLSATRISSGAVG